MTEWMCEEIMRERLIDSLDTYDLCESIRAVEHEARFGVLLRDLVRRRLQPNEFREEILCLVADAHSFLSDQKKVS